MIFLLLQLWQIDINGETQTLVSWDSSGLTNTLVVKTDNIFIGDFESE